MRAVLKDGLSVAPRDGNWVEKWAVSLVQRKAETKAHEKVHSKAGV